jgi:hypothetical protein
MSHSQIKGNRMFMVCTVCGPDVEHALELSRRKNEGYEKVMPHQVIAAWLRKHARCGDGYDHFKLGLERNPDWDKAVPVSPDSNVKAHVRLELIKSDRLKV